MTDMVLCGSYGQQHHRGCLAPLFSFGGSVLPSTSLFFLQTPLSLPPGVGQEQLGRSETFSGASVAAAGTWVSVFLGAEWATISAQGGEGSWPCPHKGCLGGQEGQGKQVGDPGQVSHFHWSWFAPLSVPYDQEAWLIGVRPGDIGAIAACEHPLRLGSRSSSREQEGVRGVHSGETPILSPHPTQRWRSPPGTGTNGDISG